MKRMIAMALVALIMVSLCACTAEDRGGRKPEVIAEPPETTRYTEPPETTRYTEPPETTRYTEPPETTRYTEPKKSWESNVLAKDPFDVFDIKRSKVRMVTFLDSVDGAPAKPYHMGKGASRRVLGWIEWNDGLADIYFAADGGINGEQVTRGLFSEMEELQEVSFNGAFHTDYAEDMSEMFYKCKKLRYVDIDQLDTGNVENMYAMFSTCVSLEELDLRSFDTSRVTNMGCMFSACRSLEYVNVSNWDTGRVRNMEAMFRWCDILEAPDISGWDLGRLDNWSKFMNDGMRINGRPWEEFFR